MKLFIPFIAVLILFFSSSSYAQAKVHIFACQPEWGALSKEIGGELVEVYTATTAYQDVHHVRAKPSLLAAMKKADLVFCSGASLENEWLPILLKKAGREDVQPATVGWLMASDFVRKLEEEEHDDHGSHGHVHPEGNPHVHLNPYNLLDVAEILAERLFLIDLMNGTKYEANFAEFKAEWEEAIPNWQGQAKALKGVNVMVYHQSWGYLTDWLGMNIVSSIEPNPGLPPTTAHLESLLQTLKNKKVKAILVAPFENDKAAKWLSEKTEIPVLYLPYTIGGNENVSTLEELFNETVTILNKGTE